MIICFIIKRHCKRLLQMHNLHGVFTACTKSAHNEPTALKKTPQRCHSVLSNTLCKRQASAFVLSMPKKRRLHRVSTAFAQRCWRMHSAHLGVLHFFKYCGNAVRTPLWCDRGFTGKFDSFRLTGFQNAVQTL